MDFFLEIHNGECSLGGHFCYHQRDHGPSVLPETSLRTSHQYPETVSTQAEVGTQKSEVRSPDEEFNKGGSTLLIKRVVLAVAQRSSQKLCMLIEGFMGPRPRPITGNPKEPVLAQIFDLPRSNYS